MNVPFKDWDSIDGSSVDEKEIRQAWRETMRRAKAMERASLTSTARHRALRFAAGFCAAAAIASVGVFIGHKASGVRPDMRQCEVIAGSLQKSKVSLPDGSKVWLNSDSRIAYSMTFGTADRTITLRGEAYFDVAKNEQIPFIVNSSGLSVKALGTKFNIRSFEDEDVTVTLMEGKVLASAGEDSAVLLPYEQVSLDRTNGRLGEVRRVDSRTALPWRMSELVFDNLSLERIAEMLESIHNIEVVFKDQTIKEYKYTGVVPNTSPAEVLDIISETSPVSFRINGNTIVLNTKTNKTK